MTTTARKNSPNDEFDPEGSLFDYMTWKTVTYAIEHAFTFPIRLAFFDAHGARLRECLVTLKRNQLKESLLSESFGSFEFPIACELTDFRGQMHKMIVSPDDIGQMITSQALTSTRLNFPVKRPNDSPEVLRAIRELLKDACVAGYELPYSIEIRDAKDQLFRTTEVHSDQAGELYGDKSLVNCAHLKFPLTVRLTGTRGETLTTRVHRDA
jgi:hypothetical protein